MKESTLQVRSQARRTQSAPLGAGLHAGQIQSRRAGRWLVQLLDGRVVEAELGPAVVPALLEEAAVDGRLVILSDGARHPMVLGALQTRPALSPTADGDLDVKVRSLRIEATEQVSLRTPMAGIELEVDGKAKLRSRRLVIDSPDHVKVRSALVELP